MSKTLRRIFVLLPCIPGLTLLLAALAVFLIDRADVWRAEQLGMAGGATLLAGWVIGAFISWRLAHPRPDPVEEEPPPPR